MVFSLVPPHYFSNSFLKFVCSVQSCVVRAESPNPQEEFPLSFFLISDVIRLVTASRY